MAVHTITTAGILELHNGAKQWIFDRDEIKATLAHATELAAEDGPTVPIEALHVKAAIHQVYDARKAERRR